MLEYSKYEGKQRTLHNEKYSLTTT